MIGICPYDVLDVLWNLESRVSIKSDLLGFVIDTVNLNIMLFDIKATKFDFNSGKNIYKNITVIQNKLVIYH